DLRRAHRLQPGDPRPARLDPGPEGGTRAAGLRPDRRLRQRRVQDHRAVGRLACHRWRRHPATGDGDAAVNRLAPRSAMQGVTLVELMVALVLGLIVTGAA